MKSVFITGANRGLGYGFVEYLTDNGWQVFGGVRKITPSLPNRENLFWIQIDISDDASIMRAVAGVKRHVSAIDLLINNAGVNKDTATHNHKEKVCTLQDLERGALQKMFNINSISPLIVLQQFLPLLTHNPSFVINISSRRASFQNESEKEYANYGYRASKVALNMITACSVQDVPSTLRTFSVHPGNVRTEMNPDGEDDPKTQAKKIIAITESWNENWNGKFMRYDGTLYPI